MQSDGVSSAPRYEGKRICIHVKFSANIQKYLEKKTKYPAHERCVQLCSQFKDYFIHARGDVMKKVLISHVREKVINGYSDN